jgi:hypothetical protein
MFGEFSTGKSTLINALLGHAALPSRLRPTTGHAIRVTWGPRPEAAVTFRDGRRESCGLEALDGFAALDVHSRAREDVERIEVRVPAALLQGGLEIYDTPGLDDADAQTARATAVVERADLVLCVIRANQPLTAGARRLMSRWMARELGKPVVPVVNFMNLVEPEERAETRDLIRRWAGETLVPVFGRPCFEVDALAALRHSLGTTGAAAPVDDFAALRDALRGVAGASGAALRRASRTNRLQAALEAARSWNRPLLRQAAGDAAALRRRRDGERATLLAAKVRIESTAEGLALDCLAGTEGVFEEEFARLEATIRANPGAAQLKAGVPRWFDASVARAVARAGAEGDERLRSLAEPGAPAPEPLAIGELVALQQRTEARLEAVSNEGATAGGAAAGAVIGTILLGPVLGPVGTVVGGFLGGLLAGKATERQPDHVGAHLAAVRTDWDTVLDLTQDLLDARFRARVGAMAEALAEQIETYAAMVPASAEAELRQRLDAALERSAAALGDEGHATHHPTPRVPRRGQGADAQLEDRS